MKIELGRGLDQVLFGKSREEVEKILGVASEKESLFLDEEENNELDTWHYDNVDVSLGFEEEEDYKLVTISVGNSEVTLYDKPVLGLSKEEFSELLISNGNEKPEIEALDIDGNIGVFIDNYHCKFWLEDNQIIEFEFGPFFKDDDSYEWPS
jgi:hypothetical protein